MGDEIDLADYFRVIERKKRMVGKFALTVVFLALVVSLIMPETYESESVIQLAEINGKLIITSAEAKPLLESSTVILPVINEFFADEDYSLEGFRKDNLKVIILTEEVSINEYKSTPYIVIKTRADSAVKSRDVNLAVIKEFFGYTSPEFDRKLGDVLDRYNKTKIDLEKEIVERERNSVMLEELVLDLEKQIDSLSSDDLTTEGISKSTLLRTLLDANRRLLLSEEDKKINLKQTLTKLDLGLEDTLANTNGFMVVSEPQIPLKPYRPNISLNLFIALVLGLIVGVSYAIIQESLR